MSSPWTAELEVDEALASGLIREQFPYLSSDRIERFGEGWDNTAYLVDEEIVFRFPRRQVAVGLMETECRVLPSLAPRLPLAIPAPTYFGHPSERYPWPFAGYRRILGRAACYARLSTRERYEIAGPFGEFLRVLHDVKAPEAEAMGAGPDPIRRLDFAGRAPRAREQLRQHADRLPHPPAMFESELLRPEVLAYRPPAVCLAHGDLYCRHLLIHERQLSGIIDWGDLHIGDPAADLMVAYALFSGAARDRFFEAYGAVSETTERVARCRGLQHALHVLDYARAISDEELEGETVHSLSCLLQHD